MDWFSRVFGSFSHWPGSLSPTPPTDDARGISDGDMKGSFHDSSHSDHFSSLMKRYEGLFSGTKSQQPQSPRDFMLKEPDTSSSNDPSDLRRHPEGYDAPFFPEERTPSFQFFNDEDLETKEGYFHEGMQDDAFSLWPSDPFSNAFSPFRMMEEMMRAFDFSHQPFSEFGGFHHGSQDGPHLNEETDRTDKDIDDSSKHVASLLKEGPAYSYEGSQSNPPSAGALEPSFKQSYRSTSIVRVRKPDGTIEERRKYSDSSGKEEETITTYEPSGSEDQLGSTLNPLIDERALFGKGGVFSWIFPRF